MNNKTDLVILRPKFAGEIIVAKKNAMNIYNTKIDDMVLGIVQGLPSHTKEEKLKHYCYKLKLVWEGRLCLE